MVEGGMVRAEYTGVEQVPELQHHEEGEEHGEVVRRHAFGRMVVVPQHAHQYDEEDDAHADDVPPHGARDDEVRALAGLFLHHVLAGRDGSQGQGGEGVHDEVHPQHLRHRQGQVGADERAQQHDEQGHEVDGQLEDDEALDVLVERASPHDGRGDAVERVVQQGDVAGFLGHGGARSHREAHLGVVQGGGIVRAVAGHGHYGSLLLQQLHEALLVRGAGARHDFQVQHAVQGLFVGEFGKGGAGDAVAFRVLGLPQAYLAGNLGGGARRVARDNLHADAGGLALAYGGRHVRTDGVADGYDAQEGQVVAAGQFHAVLGRVVIHNLVGKAQGAHGHVLVGEQLLVHGGAVFGSVHALAVQDDVPALAQHDFRGALHVEHLLAQQGRLHQRGHVLPFGGEGQLVQHRGVLAQRQVVLPLLVEPEQQGHFGGIAHAFGLLARGGFFEEGGGVGADALGHQVADVVLAQVAVVLQGVEVGFVHLHEVLRQRAGLVGADGGDGTHRLAGVHLAHQVVGGEHAPHVQRQAERDAHGQTLGHGHDDEGDGHHEVLQRLLQGRQPVVEGVEGREVIVEQHILDEEDGEGQSGGGEAYLADEVGQARQLDVQRGGFGGLLGALPGHFAYLRSVAHGVHAHRAVSVHHGGAAQHAVGGVGGVLVEVGFDGGLADDGFARQVRFVDLQGDGLEQLAVGGHLFARLQHDDVAHNHILAGNLLHVSVADDLDFRLLVHLVQQVELLVGVVFKEESDARGQQDGGDDAYGLGIFVLHDGDDQREEGGHEQHLDHRVLEFLQVEFPHGGTFGGRHQVDAVFGTAFPYLFVGQADVVVILFHCVH